VTQAEALVKRVGRHRWLVVAVLAVCAFTFDYFLAERHGFFDLRVYYGAINYWIHEGGSLYDYLLPKSTYGFTYPPFAALTMVPMAVTPWHLAIAISCVTCLAATAIVLYWLVDPVARRQGWTRWYVLGLTLGFAIAFEPLRETFLFGQVNMYLLFLVAADLVMLVGRGNRWGGVLIGLATAIKLTPGIFILYLLVTKRWRAAIVASATAAVATVFAAIVAPDSSLVFWSDALWNTDRVGAIAFISNQSLNGAIARAHAADPSTLAWLICVVVILAIWVVRIRRTAAAGDELTGFALTGIVGCLISPITWIHHLVWVGPAIVLLLDSVTTAKTRRRRYTLLAFMIFSYALLSSRFVWDYHDRFGTPVLWFFSNAYVWISIALLLALPVRTRPVSTSAGVEPVANLGEIDREFAGLIEGERAPAAVKPKAVPLVEGARPDVAVEHP
jgi:alpha-1,2-mannosyltransferase